MKTFCITTEDKNYKRLAEKCVESAKQFDIDVELKISVPISQLEKVAKQNDSFLKYSAGKDKRRTDYINRTCPVWRISNGLTHYLLYRWSAENQTSICILESDAVFIDNPPEAIDDGVIQISSHKRDQMTAKTLFKSGRTAKLKQFAPKEYVIWEKQFDWNCCDTPGVIKHPLTGMIGTSGYIVGYKAAESLVEYFSKDGIGFADRVREEHIGHGNLYLQIPQSVIVPRHGNYKKK